MTWKLLGVEMVVRCMVTPDGQYILCVVLSVCDKWEVYFTYSDLRLCMYSRRNVYSKDTFGTLCSKLLNLSFVGRGSS